LETNGVIAVGSYSVSLVAVQAGISNSPYCQNFTLTGSSGAPNVVQFSGAYISPGACSSSCTPFTITTAAGNLVYIAAEEYSPVNTNGYAVLCNGTPATLVTSSIHSGDISGWLFSCPAAAGSLVVTAGKSGALDTSFQIAEIHSISGTPTNDVAASGYGAASNVANAALGSATTSASDLLISFGSRGGGSASFTFGGGGAGSWTSISGGLGAYQVQTTTGTFTTNITATGGAGGTILTTAAVHP
jgi:hypothetical protein